MTARRWQIGIVTTLLAMGFPVVGGAQSAFSISGAAGVDLDGYTFRKEILEDNQESKVTRTLTNSYLDLQIGGPLVSRNFADFLVSGRLSGTSYRSRTSESEDNGGDSPTLTSYAGRLSIFGERSYPLGLYLSRSELPSLRYEVSNRAESDLESPALAVIRRYDSVLERRGGVWKTALPKSGDLSFEIQRSENTTDRRYDFGEDQDIYVDFATIRPDTVTPVHPVVVRNEIPDDTVLIFINQALVDTLAAGESVTLSLETGSYSTEFVPLRLNSFRATVDVDGEMQWKIVHNPPPGSKDVAQVTDVARGMFNIGGDGAFQNETFYEFNKIREDVQRMDSRLSTFNNMARYEFSPTTKVDLLTTFTQNDTDIEEVSSQSAGAFQQQSNVRWNRSRGPSAHFSHSYGRMSTETDVTKVVSTTNTVLASGRYPTGWHDHESGLRLSATHLADDLGYRSKQYTSELDNKMKLRTGRLRYEPRQLIKYMKSSRENPDGATNELESQSTLTGEVLKLDAVGQVKFKGEFNWRRRETDAGTTTKKKYFGELGIARNVMEGVKLGFITSHELETYGDAGSTSGPGSSSLEALESQVRRSYRLDLESSLAASFIAGGNAMLVTTNDTRIRRFTGSLSARVPKLNVPIRSSLINEKRSLTGLPDQTLFQIDTRMNFSFRRVTLTVNHSIVRDRQLTEEYKYQKILAKIVRNFDVM